MALEDIPEVQIEHSGDYKFVQIEGPEGRNYIYGKGEWGTHYGVFSNFKSSLSEHNVDASNFRCQGGGRIEIDNDNKLVEVHGKSLDYGHYDERVVAPLIKNYVSENMDEFSVNVFGSF